MDPRAINFNVLRRHDPRISSILDSTSYAVIYRYFHGAWSKTGFEGTLFISRRDTHPFNAIFVLNRQGLDNLCEGLLAGWNVDLDEGLIIWRSAGATGDSDDDVIYGIWVYEEKDRTRIATTMQELVNGASAHQDPEPTPSPPPVSLSHPVPRVPIISAGQTISLDQLFGVGSVCSEPPPQTSALPHPGTSVTDQDEPQDMFLPSKILSPEASDLPKGMQLLDSLFQKAAIKSQTSHQPSPNLESTNQQQPLSIQQFIDQTSALTSKGSSQNSPTKSKPMKAKRDRHQSSTVEETYQVQSTGVTQAVPVKNRVINNPSHLSRPDHRSVNHSNNNSRRSSGGSSSRSRNDGLPMTNHVNSQTHQHSQLLAQLNLPSPSGFVAAPVPIQNVNAEARHNILSLLGHPAATRPNNANPSQTFSQNSPLLTSPSAEATGGFSSQNPIENSRRTYQSEQRFHPSAGTLINTPSGSHPGSQTASQQPSPNLNGRQTFMQHPAATASHGKTAHPSSPRAAHIQSVNHSPNGPRPQMDARHPPPPTPHPPSGSSSSPQALGSNVGQTTGPLFSTSVWPFNQPTPTRALSPLNPARQSPSNANNQVRAIAPAVNYRKSNNFHDNQQQNLPHLLHSQQRDLVDQSPPEINDSSRPIKPAHYAINTVVNNVGLISPKIHSDQISVNPKIVVKSLRELLTWDDTSPKLDQTVHPSALDHLNHADLAPLDKAQFVNGILDLIDNNGPFVDTLYARYLARYAEKHL